jgi:hypothetical protein
VDLWSFASVAETAADGSTAHRALARRVPVRPMRREATGRCALRTRPYRIARIRPYDNLLQANIRARCGVGHRPVPAAPRVVARSSHPGTAPFDRMPDTSTRARAILAAISTALALSAVPSSVRAQWVADGDQFRIAYGPSAYHFSGSDGHVKYNHMVSAELLTSRWTFWGAERTQIGLALLDNSFGQFSQYVFAGQEWDLGRFAGGQVFGNVTAGLLHGYKDPYENKIPFNQLGIAPVIIPALGWRYQRFSLFATVLGTNGFLFAASWTFDATR